MTLSAREIVEWFETRAIDAEWSFAGTKPSETVKWTHGYHRYPAKFIPQLVEKLMDAYVSRPDARVNDPFMGCGTTIVSAIARGYCASGTDINRIAHLITTVKATPIEPEYLEEKIRAFVASAGRAALAPLTPERHRERIDYWFCGENRDELGRLLRVIHREEDTRVRDFFLVAFSHILKNCSRWLQGSTKPTRDLKKKPAQPLPALKKHLAKMERGNAAFYRAVPHAVKREPSRFLQVRDGDARTQPDADASVDVIVSSSPYVTSYEYADLHQLSTLWLDLADDLPAYKEQFIGTSRKKYADQELGSEIAQSIVRAMSRQSEGMAKEVAAFFADMQEVFAESFRILRRGGRCCYVIGNTKLKRVEILNAQVFAESLQNCGFKLDRLIQREIPSKILPQKRDEKTGRFANNDAADAEAYPVEYIVVGLKE